MIGREFRSEALGELLDARMYHMQWIDTVTYEDDPQVEEHHTKCKFGKWILKAGRTLNCMDEFRELDENHRELHSVFRILKNNPDHELLLNEMKLQSKKLITSIDLLELRLNGPVVRGDDRSNSFMRP